LSILGEIMARNLVVLADGTGNSAAKAFKTNVWRLYQALDLGGAQQIASFSDGVGTSQFKPFEIIGLALGFGVKRRVLTLYKFLCLNYSEDDDIYAFGFSRGAFTARVLVGLINREGLVDFKSTEELDRNAVAAYRAFRKEAFSTWMPWVQFGRWARDAVIWTWNEIIGNRQYDEAKPKDGPRAAGKVKVKFLGVWDTVAAYGLPVDELTRAVNGVVWPMTFEKKDLLNCVERARQAFSIDDERRTFFPIRWDEPPPMTVDWPNDPSRLLQVWFAGSHSNVGGGYPDDRLSHIPLCWMIAEAAECGLSFKPEIVAQYWDYASETGRIYDSRSALGVFYRYHPRSAADLMGDGVSPLVHSSVLVRIADGSDGYAPVSLPRKIDILTPSGDRIPFGHTPAFDKPESTATRRKTDALPLPKSRRRDLSRMDAELAGVVRQLQDDREDDRRERVALMEDTIWWRRGLYYVLLSLAVVAALFPFLVDYIDHEATGQIDLQVQGVIGPLLGLLKGFLPGLTHLWVDSIALHSTIAGVLAALLGFCLWLNAFLRTRIADRARQVWNIPLRKDGGELTASRATAHRRSAMLGFLLAAVLAFVAANRDGPRTAAVLATIAIVCLAVFGFARRTGYKGRDRGSLSFLGFARAIRTNDWAIKIYWALRTWILPGAFLIASTILVLAVANKTAFSVADSMGAFCSAASDSAPIAPGERVQLDTAFAVSSMCWSTGRQVKEGVTYRLAFAVIEPWTDGGNNADPYGFGAGAQEGFKARFAFAVGTLIKRWWSEPWMRPIARIGRFGNDEYALAPLQPDDKGLGNNTQLTAEFTARSTGELYLYVNDAVIALPNLYDWFYRGGNNKGTASVSLEVAKE
jgi:uncharacterized protein (DUF2235 family)